MTDSGREPDRYRSPVRRLEIHPLTGLSAARETQAAARRKRLANAAGTAVAAVAVLVALVIPSPQPDCSYTSVDHCGHPYGLIPLRLGIVAAGLIIAVFVVWDGRAPRRSRW